MKRRDFLWSLGAGLVTAAFPLLRAAPRRGCDQNCLEALKEMHEGAKRGGWSELQMYVSPEVGERLRGGGGFRWGAPFITFHLEHWPYRLDNEGSFVVPFIGGPKRYMNPAWVCAEYELMLGAGRGTLVAVMFRRG